MADDQFKQQARDAGSKAAQTIWQDYYESSPHSSIQDAQVPNPNNPQQLIDNPKVEAAANYFLTRGRMALNEFGTGLSQSISEGSMTSDQAMQQMEQFAQGMLADRKRFYEDSPKAFLKAQETYFEDIFNYNRQLETQAQQAELTNIENDFALVSEDAKRLIDSDLRNIDAVRQTIGELRNSALETGADPQKIDRAARDAFATAESTFYEKFSEEAPFDAKEELNRNRKDLTQSYGADYVDRLDKRIEKSIERGSTEIQKEAAAMGRRFAKGENIDAQPVIDKARLLGMNELADQLNNMKRVQHNLRGADINQLQEMSESEDPIERQMANTRLQILSTNPLEAMESGGYAQQLQPVNYLNPSSFAERALDVDSAADALGMNLPLIKKKELDNFVQKLEVQPPRQIVQSLNDISNQLNFSNQHRLTTQLINSAKGNKLGQTLLVNENFRQTVIETANSDIVQGRSLSTVKREAGIWVDKHLKDLSKPLKMAYKGILAAGKANGLDFNETAEEYSGIIEGNEDRMFIPPVPMAPNQAEKLYESLTENIENMRNIGNGAPVGLDGKEIDVEDREYHPIPSGKPGIYHLIDADTGRKVAVQRKDGKEIVFVPFEMKVAE